MIYFDTSPYYTVYINDDGSHSMKRIGTVVRGFSGDKYHQYIITDEMLENGVLSQDEVFAIAKSRIREALCAAKEQPND